MLRKFQPDSLRRCWSGGRTFAKLKQNLIAANAQIGVAKAAYFPQISLTGTAGYESPALTNLFTGPAGVWNLAASFTQPIFEGGQAQVQRSPY